MKPVFDRRTGVTALVLLAAILLAELGAVPAVPSLGTYVYGFPFSMVSLKVAEAGERLTFFGALGRTVTGWAVYPLPVLVNLGLLFLGCFLAASVAVPLVDRK